MDIFDILFNSFFDYNEFLKSLKPEERQYLRRLHNELNIDINEEKQLRHERFEFIKSILSDYYSEIPNELLQKAKELNQELPLTVSKISLVFQVLKIISEYENIHCPLDDKRLLRIEEQIREELEFNYLY